MKKTFFVFLSLALLLSLGTFAVKAVTQSAFDTNSFNFTGSYMDSYVQNEVYKWKYNSNIGKCEKVKLPTVNTTGYFDTEAKCLEANKASAYSYSSGSATGNLDLSIGGNIAPTGKSTPSSSAGTAYTGGSATGLGGFSFGDSTVKPTTKQTPSAIGGLDFSGTGSSFGGLTFEESTTNKIGVSNSTNLFGTDVKFGDSTTNKTLGGVEEKSKFSFSGLLQSFGLMKADDTVSPMGVGENFVFTATPTEVDTESNTSILTWKSSDKGYVKCNNGNKVQGVTGWNGQKDLPADSPAGGQKVTFSSTKDKTFKLGLTCYNTAGESAKEYVDVVFAAPEEEDDEPGKLSVKITATPEAVALKDGKASIKLSWETENAVSCSTNEVKDVTGWSTNAKLDVKSKSPVEVNFTKEGSYTFGIVCSDSNKKEEKDTVTVTVSKEGEKPPESGKPASGTLGDYKNDCSFVITADGFTHNIVNKEQAQKVEVKFTCKGEAGKETGHDVRPISFGLFVNETVGNKTNRYECDPKPSASKGSTYLGTDGETMTLSCNFNADKFASLFDMDKDGNNQNNNLKMLLAYVEFYTNQDDGSWWEGKYNNVSRIERINATRTPHLSFISGKGNQGSGKYMNVQATPQILESEGGKVAITAEAKGYKACTVTSDELKGLNLPLTGSEEKLSLAKNYFTIPANSTNSKTNVADRKPEYYYLNITCDGTKGNSFMITVKAKEDPKAPGTDNKPPSSCNDESQKPKACTIVPTISTPTVEVNKNSKVGGEIKGSVLISNCNWGNTGKIFLTTGLRIDGVNIPMTPVSGRQITSALDRNWSIKWADLPSVTRENILKTLNSKDSNGKFYTGATIAFEYYSGQSIGTNKLTKDNTCGWVNPDPSRVLSVTFKVKGTGSDNNGGKSGDEGDSNDTKKETSSKTLLSILNPDTNKFKIVYTDEKGVSQTLVYETELTRAQYDKPGTYRIEVLVPNVNKDGKVYKATYAPEWKINPNNPSWIYQDVVLQKGDSKIVTIKFDSPVETASLLTVYNDMQTYVIIYFENPVSKQIIAINDKASQSKMFSYSNPGVYYIHAYIPRNGYKIPATGGWTISDKNTEYMMKKVSLAKGQNISVEIKFDKTESGGNTIQSPTPNNCSIAKVYDLTINKNTIPSATIQLKNIGKQYAGINKVSGYITIDGKNIYLPDWKFNGSGGMNDLVYPFNLDTKTALNELKNIDFSKVKNATLTISTWAKHSKLGTTDFCNKHVFNLESDQTADLIKPPFIAVTPTSGGIHWFLDLHFYSDDINVYDTTGRITLKKNNETYKCSLYLNDKLYSAYPSTQKEISGKDIQSSYNLNTGKYKVYYRCLSTGSADPIASNIINVTISNI